jgi:galactose-1-phosphate uridylyltransferase
LKLERLRERARVLDPRNCFAEALSEVEVRIDPLTGARARINISRTSRPKQALKRGEESAPQKCPFCPENIDRETPKFPPDLVAEGRIRSGGAILFPNLFPLSGVHAICAFTPAHKLDIDSFTPEEILDGLACCRRLFEVGEAKGMSSHFLGWNHLPPAGASLLHPHFQAIATEKPLLGPDSLFEASETYARREGKCYWSELVEGEMGSPRLIGETPGFTWLAPWAPMGTYEVIGIGRKSSMLTLDAAEIRGLSFGITKVLSGLWNLGVNALNMGLYSMPRGEGESSFRTHVRIMGRPNSAISDRALLELYGGEVGVTTLPEEYAKSMKEKF